MARWMQKAAAGMKARGTEGSFTRSAEQAGESVAEHAESVLDNPRASTKQKRRAAFAKAARKVSRSHGR